MFTVTIQHQLDQQTRDLIVQKVVGQVTSIQSALVDVIRKEIEAMSEAIASRVTAFGEAVNTATTAMTAGATALQASANTITDLTAKLAAGEAPTADELAALDSGIAQLNQASAALTAVIPPAGDQVVEPTPSEQPQG